jgi:hypothetical protein
MKIIPPPIKEESVREFRLTLPFHPHQPLANTLISYLSILASLLFDVCLFTKHFKKFPSILPMAPYILEYIKSFVF